MSRSRSASLAAMSQRSKSGPRASKQTGMTILLSTGILLLGILLYLWPQMRLINLGYQQGRLQAQREQLLKHQKELRVELATLRQLSRIEEIAVRRLHMQTPQTSQIIYVHPGQDIIEPGGGR
jgi:cell division protein FtsL